MDEAIAALGETDGWLTEGYAARIHYRGAADRYSVEYYAPNDCVVYWRVDDGEAVPVARGAVPDPLRTRVRDDLATAGVDPAIEKRRL